MKNVVKSTLIPSKSWQSRRIAMKNFVIINPEAAAGRSLRVWHHLSDRIFEHIGLFDYEFTNARGSATLLAAQAVKQGYERVIAVGGDGTVNEVLNGLFDEHGQLVNPKLVLGCLPAGSGTDFWKSLHVSDQLRPALARVAAGTPRWCDIGRVELTGHNGQPISRYFCNVADVGLGGVVLDKFKRLPNFTRGSIGYILATLASLSHWQPEAMEIILDGKALPVEPYLITLIANGAYCGGGMCVAPDARFDDGVFHVVRVRPFNWPKLARLIPQVYTGRLRDDATVTTTPAKTVQIITPRPLKITVDGEVPGLTPARFTILPKAIRVLA